MVLRKQEEDQDFKEKLKNPLNPVNDTSPSPEMEEYLHKLNSGELEDEERKKREEAAKKMAEEDKKYSLFCPTCRRPSLKKAPQGYACGFCGLETNAPLKMAVSEHEIKEREEAAKKAKE